MKLLTFDYETRSRANLKATGPWPYAEDPYADIICAALKCDDEPPYFWVNMGIYDGAGAVIPDYLRSRRLTKTQVVDLMNSAPVIEAHNAAFERAITECIAIKKYGWNLHPSWVNRLSCTASRAASMSLPRSLDQVCKILNVSQQKDSRGKDLIQRLCIWNEKTQSFGNDPTDLIEMLEYCLQDAEAEYALSKALNHLSPFEKKLWHLDQKINARGIPLDMDLIRSAIKLIDQYSADEIPKIVELTNGKVSSPRQVAEMVKWCVESGYNIKDMKSATVEKALKDPKLPGNIAKVLRLRSAFGKSSTSKFSSMISCASADGRARDTMMFHGASTGRWTGKRVQPHNFTRRSLKEDTDFYLDMIKKGRLDVIKAFQSDPMFVFSACLRPAIRAAEGKELIGADFNAIEGRCLAWIAGDQHILEDYIAGLDPYKKVASIIFGVPYKNIDKTQRQSGKIAELACGYRGGPGAARRFGAVGTDAEIRAKYITPWRKNRPGTVQFWADIEQCALSAATDMSNRSYRCRVAAFGKHGDFLYCRLPSGRMLAYYKPEVAWVGAIKFEEDDNIYKTPLFRSESETLAALDEIRSKKSPKKEDWAMAKLAVTVESLDATTGRMVRGPVHGGVWTERITQAVARDILAWAMLRLDAAGFSIVLHIHDEIVSEIIKGSVKLDDYIRIMSEVPSWAPGLPMGGEGWISDYLIKG